MDSLKGLPSSEGSPSLLERPATLQFLECVSATSIRYSSTLCPRVKASSTRYVELDIFPEVNLQCAPRDVVSVAQ